MWVVDPERVKVIVRTLSDEYSRKIISATIEQAKSPEEISIEQNIPVSTCYRRIHDLVSLSMIRVGRVVLTDGKKLFRYRSVYKNIIVRFESMEPSVELVSNTNPSIHDYRAEQENIQTEKKYVAFTPAIVIKEHEFR